MNKVVFKTNKAVAHNSGSIVSSAKPMEAGNWFKNHTAMKKVFLWAWLAAVASVCVCVAQENKVITERLKQKYSFVYYDKNNGYYSVWLNGKQGTCDLSGKEIVPCKYDEVFYHKDKGYYSVQLNGKRGACDLQGNEIPLSI